MNTFVPSPGTWFHGLLPDARSDILANLVSGVADVAILVRLDGTVSNLRARPDLDLTGAVLNWIDTPLAAHLRTDSAPKLDRCLSALRNGASELPMTELNLNLGEAGQDLPMSFSFHHIGTETDVLMLGRDLRPLADVQQQLIAAQIALERDYEAQRDVETRLRILMAATTDAYVFVNVAGRAVTEANSAAAQLLGFDSPAQVEGALESLIRVGPDSDLIAELLDSSRQPDGRLSVTLCRNGMEVEVTSTSFRIPGSHMLLCQLSAQQASEDGTSEISERLTAFFSASPDAIVFAAGDGRILSANGSFLDLVEQPQELNVRGRSLGDFLTRGNVDLSALLASAGRSGSLKLFSTRIESSPGQSRAVEISITRIKTGVRSIFALVLRDTSRSTSLRPESVDPSVDMEAIMALIGKQSLKDIVSQATDVIERMCIGAAVDLTSNNRVAAADMLGLSRQSLYVKLRKFDLVKRESTSDT